MHATQPTPVESISWREVVAAFQRYRWLALGVFLVTVLSTTAVAFLMTPVYRSEALLVPAKEDQSSGGLSAKLGGLAGLAGLAGITLPGAGSGTTQQAIKLLESRGFLAEFIRRHDLLTVLFPGDWDPKAQRWTVAADRVPTLDDGVERFRRKVLNVDDSAGSTIRVVVDWTDRETAAQWANDLVATLNERMRQRAIEESRNSLEYLNKQLGETTTLEVRQSIYRLMEEQLNKAMLANVRREYVFEVLDPAVPADADRPQRPRKHILISVGLLLGLALAALAVALRAGLTRPATAQ